MFNFKMTMVTAALLCAPIMAQATSMRTAGTLTCTLEPTSGRMNEIACTYRPVDGKAEAKFRGDLVRVGANSPVGSSRVLVWMVVGQESIEPADLEATFIRKNPTSDSIPEPLKEGLVGGVAGRIVLVPPSGKEQLPGNAAITVLELNLMSVRV